MAGETIQLKAGEANPLKTVAVVLGALAFGWAAIELALKPLLGKASKDKSVEAKAKELAKEVEDAADLASASVTEAVAEATS
ncbi:hypothetical protein CTI12_AA418420 [Artemisia annua]|uniref:Uncharacterized protein n=1 Tax=Artemisia annua TaxID=35608 RepID=A0A2U1M5N1_ARTAN|nr:hypothetical protein CTI12_AA418420 [Artemisia annua]